MLHDEGCVGGDEVDRIKLGLQEDLKGLYGLEVGDGLEVEDDL